MSENLKLKTQVVMLQYAENLAPVDEMIVAIDTVTRKLDVAFLSNLSHLQHPVHFYLISDRDIWMGDFYYNKLNREVYQITHVNDLNANTLKGQCYKVEASSDPRLTDTGIPKIPPTFIGKYRGKVFDVTQVNIDVEHRLNDVFDTRGITRVVASTRPDGTVKLSKVDPKFTYEDMLKAYQYGRWSKDPTFSHFGQTGDEFLAAEFDFDVPKN